MRVVMCPRKRNKATRPSGRDPVSLEARSLRCKLPRAQSSPPGSPPLPACAHAPQRPSDQLTGAGAAGIVVGGAQLRSRPSFLRRAWACRVGGRVCGTPGRQTLPPLVFTSAGGMFSAPAAARGGAAAHARAASPHHLPRLPPAGRSNTMDRYQRVSKPREPEKHDENEVRPAAAAAAGHRRSVACCCSQHSLSACSRRHALSRHHH